MRLPNALQSMRQTRAEVKLPGAHECTLPRGINFVPLHIPLARGYQTMMGTNVIHTNDTIALQVLKQSIDQDVFKMQQEGIRTLVITRLRCHVSRLRSHVTRVRRDAVVDLVTFLIRARKVIFSGMELDHNRPE